MATMDRRSQPDEECPIGEPNGRQFKCGVDCPLAASMERWEIRMAAVETALLNLARAIEGRATPATASAAAVAALRDDKLSTLIAEQQRRWEIYRPILVAVAVAALGVLAAVLLQRPR